MSDLLRLLEAKETGNVRIADVPPCVIRVDSEVNDIMHELLTEVRVGVFLGNRAYVSQQNPKKYGEELVQAKQNIHRAIVEQVFGEFRTPLLELEMALRMRDYDKALTHTRQIYEEMFS